MNENKPTILNVELDSKTREQLKNKARENGRSERREAEAIIKRSVNR